MPHRHPHKELTNVIDKLTALILNKYLDQPNACLYFPLFDQSFE